MTFLESKPESSKRSLVFPTSKNYVRSERRFFETSDMGFSKIFKGNSEVLRELVLEGGNLYMYTTSISHLFFWNGGPLITVPIPGPSLRVHWALGPIDPGVCGWSKTGRETAWGNHHFSEFHVQRWVWSKICRVEIDIASFGRIYGQAMSSL